MWWDSKYCFADMAIVMLWIGAILLVPLGWVVGWYPLGQLGGLAAIVAGSLTVMRDNHRTRRMLARPGEQVRPLR